MNENTQKKSPSAIRRVTFYTASPVECCDRCSQGIKNVALVEYKDGLFEKYGMDCIDKILSGDTTLKSLFRKNAKLVKKYRAWLEILSRPEGQISADRPYYDRGIYIITDEDGAIISWENGRCLFHPTKIDQKFIDTRDGQETFGGRDANGKFYHWRPATLENFQIDLRWNLKSAREWLQKELDRLEGFLARVLAKGLVKAEEVAQ
jgi:hypothetical protein